MKKLVCVLFAFALAGCYHASVQSPGMTADGVSPYLPSPAYGSLVLQDKQMAYQYSMQAELVNYQFKLQQAWEACLGSYDAETCREIHGGYPYYMGMGMGYGGGYGMSGWGSPMMGYPGCPYMSANWCDTWVKTQAGIQMAQVMTAQQQAYSQYASAAASVWSTPSASPDYSAKIAELKAIAEKILDLEIEETEEALAATTPSP